MRLINSIFTHHSLTRDSGTVSWQAIRSYHEGKGWNGIGYHFGIERINDRYEVLVGRDVRLAGAHCWGHNHNSIGICFVGNFDICSVPPEQWALGVQLVRSLKDVFKIRNVYGHNEASAKSCPGKYFDMDLFRSLV